MTTSRQAVVVVVASALTSLLGCSGSSHDPAEKFILVAAGTKVQYWQTAQAGLMTAARELGVKGQMDGPDAHDAQGEHEAFRRAIAQKPSGILVSVADSKLMEPDIKAALAQKIPVITIDSDAPESDRLLFVGTDNYSAGITGGKMVAKLLNGKGNVVIFKLPNQSNQTGRLTGYQAALAAFPGIKVTQVIDLQEQPDRSGFAYDTVKRMITNNSKADAFVCLESRSCGGVADAVSRSNLTGKTVIVAMDTDPEIVGWLQKGVISATVAQKPYTMAYYGTKLLDDLFHHPPTPLDNNWTRVDNAPVPHVIDTGSFVVDKGGLASFLEHNKSLQAGQ